MYVLLNSRLNATHPTLSVATSEAYRGQGLATHLLAHSVKDMIRQHVNVSFLHASLDGPRRLYGKPENGYVSLPMPVLSVRGIPEHSWLCCENSVMGGGGIVGGVKLNAIINIQKKRLPTRVLSLTHTHTHAPLHTPGANSAAAFSK